MNPQVSGLTKTLPPPKPHRPPISNRIHELQESNNGITQTSELARFIDESSSSEVEENLGSNHSKSSKEQVYKATTEENYTEIQTQLQKLLTELPQTFAAFQINPLTKIEGRIGLETLLHQLQVTYFTQGFAFNLMVIGEYGLGKTSLLNALFNTPHLFPSYHIDGKYTLENGSTTQLREREISIEEGGMKLNLNLIDTPGFGANIDNSAAIFPVLNYLQSELEHYFQQEYLAKYRSKRSDRRVHLAIYMVNPNVHALRPFDLWCLRCLSDRVNVLPVIAKADTLTREELITLKMQLKTQLDQEEIQYFNSMEQPNDKFRHLLSKMIPFGVVSPDQESHFNSQKDEPHSHRMTRTYPWGDLEVDNPNHCEFLHLRAFIVSNMKFFVDLTHEQIYENYRFHSCSTLLRSREPLCDSETQTYLYEML